MKQGSISLRLRTSQHHRTALRNVFVLTSSVVLLLFIGLFICINFTGNSNATASSVTEQRYVNH